MKSLALTLLLLTGTAYADGGSVLAEHLPLALGDCGSTAYALDHGARETNLLFHNVAGCVGAHAVVAVAVTLWEHTHNRANKYHNLDEEAVKSAGQKRERILVGVLGAIGGALIAHRNLSLTHP